MVKPRRNVSVRGFDLFLTSYTISGLIRECRPGFVQPGLASVEETGEVVEGGFAPVVGGGAFHV